MARLKREFTFSATQRVRARPANAATAADLPVSLTSGRTRTAHGGSRESSATTTAIAARQAAKPKQNQVINSTQIPRKAESGHARKNFSRASSTEILLPSMRRFT